MTTVRCAAGAGLDEHERADEPGMCGGGEHGGVPAQRLADQDGPLQRQMIDNGDDVDAARETALLPCRGPGRSAARHIALTSCGSRR